jgi:hypothetical protein
MQRGASADPDHNQFCPNSDSHTNKYSYRYTDGHTDEYPVSNADNYSNRHTDTNQRPDEYAHFDAYRFIGANSVSR